MNDIELPDVFAFKSRLKKMSICCRDQGMVNLTVFIYQYSILNVICTSGRSGVT